VAGPTEVAGVAEVSGLSEVAGRSAVSPAPGVTGLTVVSRVSGVIGEAGLAGGDTRARVASARNCAFAADRGDAVESALGTVLASALDDASASASSSGFDPAWDSAPASEASIEPKWDAPSDAEDDEYEVGRESDAVDRTAGIPGAGAMIVTTWTPRTATSAPRQ